MACFYQTGYGPGFGFVILFDRMTMISTFVNRLRGCRVLSYDLIRLFILPPSAPVIKSLPVIQGDIAIQQPG